jgi:hypothetical protein
MALLLYVGFAVAQTPPSSPPPAAQEPKDVTLCQLSQNPSAYNHALVKDSGTASQGFENFTFADSTCKPPTTDHFWPWMTYGGTMQSGTAYCCPGEGEKKERKQPIEVECVSVSLVNDGRLKRFMALLTQKPHTARATLIGVFLAGEPQATNGRPTLPGYGHLGCCSLLVIRHVESVEP